MNAPPPAPPPAAPPRILIYSLNWLGDAIMSMPALQLFRAENPSAHITLLCKPNLAQLWAMHPAPNRVLPLYQPPQAPQTPQKLIKTLREQKFEVSYILPHSFRSALIPFLSKIPQRIGLPGHFPRDFMLTDVRKPISSPERTHQAFEYLDLFLPDKNVTDFPPPALKVPQSALAIMRAKLAQLPHPWIAVIPGAARGPSKRWPMEHYAETAATLVAETGGSIITLGTDAEHPICQQVAAASAPNGLNLAGKTNLLEFSAVLTLAQTTICNDSGGMHLAAALGTPLVAIFGITDPQKTGPIGKNITILQKSDQRSRDISRHSAAAEEALRAITPAETTAAALESLKN